MQLVAQVGSGLRSDRGRLVERVAHRPGPHPLDEPLLELPQHGLDDDEALGRDAALAAVDEPRGGAGLGRRVEVGVLEHDVGIAAAELEDALLQAGAGLRGDGAAGGGAAGERHRGDVR